MSTVIIFAIVLTAVLALSKRSWACTCVVVGKGASATGHVIVGHNEDDPGRAVVARHLVPPSEKGITGPFEPCSSSMKVEGPTLGYIWSQVRTTPGQSGADCYLNEKGVFIASDNCRDSRQDNEPDLSGGGVVYGLRTILAAKAPSAREGVSIATDLLDRYGYGQSGRCYTIADKDEAWMVQVVMGKHYCARRIDDNEVAFMPNHYTIDKVIVGDPRFVLSPGLVELAKSKGWLVGDEREFDFAATFQDPDSRHRLGNTYRHVHGLRKIAGKIWDISDLPFSAKPTRPVDVQDVMDILREHYHGTDDDIRDGDSFSPHYTSVRRICTGTTLESLVIRFRDRPELITLWTATGRPCTSPFVPWYGGIVGMPKDQFVEDCSTALERQFAFKPSDFDYDSSLAWWAVQDLQSLLDGQYDLQAEKVRAHVEQVERTWLAEDDRVVEKALSLLQDDREKGELFLTSQTLERSEQATSMARYLYKNLPKVELSSQLSSMTKGDRYGEITLSFSHDGTVVESTMIFGQGMQNPLTWAKPVAGSLSLDNDRWSVRFRIREATESAIPCRGDFWLYGKDQEGQNIVGKTMIEVIKKD